MTSSPLSFNLRITKGDILFNNKSILSLETAEDFYFNLNKAEIMEMQLTTVGGLDAYLKKIISAQDMPTLMRIFKDLILKSYGVKSDDGRRFIKNEK